MVDEAASYYIHGSSLEEQRRLSILNDLLNERSLRELDVVGGERILDMGCGTGQFTRLMATAAGGRAFVVGIERDAAQRGEARRLAIDDDQEDLVDFRPGDATNLTLGDEEWETFDLVHARFLLEHLPDPLHVVRTMMRAAKPGGRIVLADDDHENFRPWPEPVGFARLWRAYIDSYHTSGNDPFIGRRLVGMLHQVGAVRTRNSCVFFGGCQGNKTFEAVADNLIGVIVGAREAIVKRGLIDVQGFEVGLRGLHDWKLHPSASLWYYVCWAEGFKP